MIANNTEIETIIDRPGPDFGESVRRCIAHGINDLRVVPRVDAGIVPPVESVPHVAAIVQGDPLFQHGRFWSKNQLDRPLHAVNAIDVADGHRCAAVVMLGKGEIDRRHADPIVGNGKIEFDSECRPGSAIRNRRLFDRWIRIEHRLAGNFVDAGVKMSADVRQHRALQIFVFEIHRPPVVIHPVAGEIVTQRIRIVEAVAGELIEGRIGIGQTLLVGGKGERPLPHAHLSMHRGKRNRQKRQLAICFASRP